MCGGRTGPHTEADDDRGDEERGGIEGQCAAGTDGGDGDTADREARDLRGLPGGGPQAESRRVVLDGEDVHDKRGFRRFPRGTDQHGDDEQGGQDRHRQSGQGHRREQGGANEISADE